MTRILAGTDELAARLGEAGRPVALVADSSVVGAKVTTRIRDAFLRTGAQVRTVVLDGPGDSGSIAALGQSLDRAGTTAVVAVGGGSVLDQAKLATVCMAAPHVTRHLDAPTRSGLVVLPEGARRALPLAAVATTLGTGAEVSASACVATAGRKRLVRGEQLRPDAVLRDEGVLETLPGHLVAEGALEALFRTVSPYIGDDRPTVGDGEVEAVAARLVELGNSASRSVAKGDGPDGRTLLRIARLAARSHLPPMHEGRQPFASRGWYLANELSTALGVRKTTAVAALLPPLWAATADGDPRWGSAERLGAIWARVRSSAAGELPADPAGGIEYLISSWGIRRQLVVDRDSIADIAQRTVRSWGGGLPMLAGLDVQAVRDVLAAAVSQRLPCPCGTEEETLTR
ncbi:daptide-type RiPP biosynthesis dehydogenase [Streptomyces sp. DSM 41972]|uniref:Daptide-type RiPP biosynthesis dehydogenase n=1 Tax=Streptomyces althioticus subsp. attaecolombicae TaxID=3075534 RepID=A0ABU3I1G2_9ACTN|nr:daptide-type RiPP biosynthesis dehydogenase [Streptomyces sp. DSM 41972]SCD31208.1 NADP-dependent alcohol dehydrogenase [Streptomyces sp. di50b]SCE29355.1 NADP-dependent alcohol dehydrogenase [Streptomyces sp. di188]